MDKVIIKHVLKNGCEVSDIRGHRVDLSQATGAAYQILLSILRRDETQAAGRCSA